MMSLASSPSQRWDRIVAAIRWEERKMEVSVSVLQDKMNSGVGWLKWLHGNVNVLHTSEPET